MLGPGRGTKEPKLWVPPEGRELLSTIGGRLGSPEMFEEAFDVHEYAEGESFEAAGFEVTPHRVLHYKLLAFGFRASANGTVVGYSGDSGPSDGLTQIARDADLFVCEATLLRPNPEGGTRGHLSSEEALEAFEASGAKRLLITHRPFERPLDGQLELARDGLEIEL
jgi:ribonuclease BN (tRNA processing enzyme)